MAEFILKDRNGKDRTFNKETIYVQGTDGELKSFTHGVSDPVVQPLEITENGTFTAPNGVDGYNPIVVEVPSEEPVLQDKEITENGSYSADEGFDGLGTVTVNIPDPTKTVILAEQETPGFAYVEDSGLSLYMLPTLSPAPFALNEGETYYVRWDGTEYECVASSVEGVVLVGNGGILGLPSTGEPFAALYDPTRNALDVVTSQEGESHTVGIWQKVTGGSSADVRYVTFKSYDGTVEYGKKPVAVGDDCADPIARGIFTTPTRESDAQYNYTFYGWATEPNGGAVSGWNKAITEDKTVYANFTSTVRYYTITYYDDDGTKVLKTESLAYGAMPSYKPSSADKVFSKWHPELSSVTGDASYIAEWKAKAAFTTLSWAEIAEICAAGEHSGNFAIGDSRPVTLSYSDGTSETINFTIVDMDTDIKATDGSTAAITLMADNIVKDSLQPASAYNKEKYCFEEMNNAKTFFTTIFEALPADLQAVVTPVYKYYFYSYQYPQKVFIATQKNIFDTDKVSSTNKFDNSQRPSYKQYAAFAKGASKIRTKLDNPSADEYWTGTITYTSSSNYTDYSFAVVDGSELLSKSPGQETYGIVPCICIG